MKKIISGTLALALATMMSVPINATSQSTTISAKIESDYKLTIPAKTEINYGSTSSDLKGELKVTGNVEANEVVKVTVGTSAFYNDKHKEEIAYTLVKDGKKFTGEVWDETELRDGLNGNAKEVQLAINIERDEWLKAKAGEYIGSITFTASLQNEE